MSISPVSNYNHLSFSGNTASKWLGKQAAFFLKDANELEKKAFSRSSKALEEGNFRKAKLLKFLESFIYKISKKGQVKNLRNSAKISIELGEKFAKIRRIK